MSRQQPGSHGFDRAMESIRTELMPPGYPPPSFYVLKTAADTHRAGRRLGELSRPGDVVILTGDLGAGKTAMTKGIAEGMGITATVTSPTFVIARWHRPAAGAGPQLIHVDAYRLGSAGEIDDLDLDVESSVTVVEWGRNVAAHLSPDVLEIVLFRNADDSRVAFVSGVGRWAQVLAEPGRPVLADLFMGTDRTSHR